MQKQKRILICPLDWGLGHATRCIPIIRKLIKKGAEVIIAADAGPLTLLRLEFPELKFIQLKGYNIQYPRTGAMAFRMLLSIPKIVNGIKEEHQQLDKIIDENKIDIVLSDNRYGCWNKKVKSIFITHQLMIKAPIAESILHKKVLKYISNYDECWIPDLDGSENLSGDLAHKYPLPKNTFFIDPLSRFHLSADFISRELEEIEMKSKYEIMAIISGPEPQRSIFEKSVIEQLKSSPFKALVVRGKADHEEKTETINNITIVSHLKAKEMQTAIEDSEIILSRSGYSTIMDLASLGKKAIFIPTPGQTEQEYLAKLCMENGVAFSHVQTSFNLKNALEASKKYKGFKII
ncbi:MAG: glycosyltransferase [Bacteroidetes bacterium]|nr:glycosyltransferase [Bacteroidota bacterium]